MRGEILNSEYELSVLNQREAELAKAQGDKRKQKGDYFLVFCLGEGANEKYALSYQYIEKVVALNVLTVIPGVPDFFLGVTYHNTEVWPVINTEKLLNISCKKKCSQSM
jgi:chemotaxis signal transduction protein